MYKVNSCLFFLFHIHYINLLLKYIRIVNFIGGPTVSGLDDNDYPSLHGMSMCFSNINQMKLHSKISLPSEIMEHFHRIL